MLNLNTAKIKCQSTKTIGMPKMVGTQESPLNLTARPNAGRDHGHLWHLAKLVDMVALLRQRMVDLMGAGVGTQTVETEAIRWVGQERNALGV